eukprot:5026649-Pyramimonas_sp.AAC.1
MSPHVSRLPSYYTLWPETYKRLGHIMYTTAASIGSGQAITRLTAEPSTSATSQHDHPSSPFLVIIFQHRGPH